MRAVERTSGQAGFSMPELLVGMSVMLVLMGAVLTQVKSAFQVSTATYEMTEAQQGLRFAQEYLNRDLVSAGDGLRGIGTIRVRRGFVQSYLTTAPVINALDPNFITLTPITSDNNVSGATPVLGITPTTTVRANTDRVTILLADPNFNAVSLPSSSIPNAGDRINLTQAQYTAGQFRVGEIYFVNSSHGATFVTVSSISNPTSTAPRLNIANSDLYGLNLTGNNGALRFVSRGAYDNNAPNGNPQPSTLVRMQIIQYFVNANGVLIRRVFGVPGRGFVDSIIADNVTNFQLRYFLADTAQFVEQLTTPTQQTALRQIELNATAETTHEVFDGRKQTVNMTASSSVRNLQFHRTQ